MARFTKRRVRYSRPRSGRRRHHGRVASARSRRSGKTNRRKSARSKRGILGAIRGALQLGGGAGDGPPTIMLLIYAHWCGFCAAVVPEWTKAMKQNKNVVMVAESDTDYESRLQEIRKTYSLPDSAMKSLPGFPSIFKISKGSIEEVEGGRTEADVLAQLQE